MEYLLITICQFIGIGFQVALKVLELDKKFPDDSLQDVLKQFWLSDKITLIISGLIVFANLVIHFIVAEYTTLETTIPNYALYNFGIALILGYAGQRIVYHYLGKAENVLIKKADKLDNI